MKTGYLPLMLYIGPNFRIILGRESQKATEDSQNRENMKKFHLVTMPQNNQVSLDTY